MADVKSKRVDIYIDTAAAEQALAGLQKKADGFNKKIEETRERQKQLLEEIKKSEGVAANYDKLKVAYTDVGKELENYKKKLKENKEEEEEAKLQIKRLNEELDVSKNKHLALAEQIEKNRKANRGTVGLQREYDLLSKEIDNTTSRIKNQTAAFNTATANVARYTKEIADTKAKQKALKEEMKLAANAGRDVRELKNQYDALDKSIATTTELLDKVREKQQKVQIQIDTKTGPSLKQQAALVAQLNRELSSLPVHTDEFADKLQELDKAKVVLSDIEDRVRRVGQAQQSITKTSSPLTKVGVFAATAGANLALEAGQAIKNAIGDLFGQNSQFEKSSQNLSAITGAVGDDLQFLKERAVELSKTGATSATEFVEAFKLVASAKPELLDAKEDLVAVTQAANLLAQASGIDLPTAATKLTDALNQFSAPANEAAIYVDALAAASKYGAAEVPDITEALLQFGSQAKSANIDIYESAGAIELLAEKGIKGAEAGTKLRNVFLALNAVDGLDKKALDALAKAGVNTQILSDKSLSLEKRLIELSKIQNNSTSLLQVFEKENFNAGQIILQNIPRYAQLTAQIKEQGVASQQAAVNTNTLETAWSRFKNVFASRFLTGTNELLKVLVERVTGLIEPAKKSGDELNAMKKSVVSLEQGTVPLITRIDELKAKAEQLGGKTKLSKEEQIELEKAIRSVGAAIPSAVSEWDKLGRVMDINSGKAREYITLQRNILKEKNRAEIQSFQTTVDVLNKEKLAKQKSIDFAANDARSVYSDERIARFAKTQEDIIKARQRRAEYIAGLSKEIDQINSRIEGAQGNIEELSGVPSKKKLELQAELAKKAEEDKKRREQEEAALRAGAGGGGTGNKNNTADSSKKRDDERIKRFKEYNEYVKQLNEQLNESLTPEGSKKWSAIFKQTEEDLLKLKALAASDEQYQTGKLVILEKQRVAIKNLLEEESKNFKPPVLNNSTVADLPKGFAEIPPVKVPVQLLPEILPEDEKAVAAAIERVVGRLNRNQQAGNELELLSAGRPKEARDILLKQLEQERQDILSNKDLTDNERALKEQQVLARMSDAHTVFRQEIAKDIDQYLGVANQVIGVLDQFATLVANRENAALKKELKANEVKKKSIRDLENNKVISAQEAKRRIAELEKDEDKKREALEKKQFERNKKIQIAQALTNGALAATNIWATVPKADFGALTFILLGLSALTTLASVATIAGSKYAKGGKLNGPSHSQGGMPVINPVTGEKEAEVEGGEYILSKQTVQNNKQLADQLLDASMNQGGKRITPRFATGGKFWEARPYRSLNYSGIKQSMQVNKYAEGGLVGKLTAAKAEASPLAPLADLLKNLPTSQADSELMEVLKKLSGQLDQGIKAELSHSRLDKYQKTEASIRKSSEFK